MFSVGNETWMLIDEIILEKLFWRRVVQIQDYGLYFFIPEIVDAL